MVKSILGRHLLAGYILIFASSCSNRPVKYSSHSDEVTTRPSIYNAWDARYNYDSVERKMVPVYNGKVVGKTWARDSNGQLSFSAYLGRSKEINEDLYPLHLSSLNRERDRKWEMNKQKRMEDVDVMLKTLEEDKKEPLMEVLIEDEEEDDFVPPAFIPSGIDLDSSSNPPPFNPVEPAASGDDELSPFFLFRRKFFCEREN